MNQLDPAQLLDSASAQCRGALTLISDPNCEPATAHELLYRAWRTTAHISCAQVPEEGGEQLSSWLAPAHLQLVRERRRASLHATLVALAAHAKAPEPWTEQARDPAAAAHPAPSAAELRASARALTKIHAALRLELQGRSYRLRRALVWTLRAGLGLGLAGVLALAVLRPWQAEDSGPWRAAYYPSNKLEGEPVVRRVNDVDFDWDKEPPLDEIPADTFSARFDTCLVLDEATEVAFMLVSDDGSRLLIDGEQAVDNWSRKRKRGKVSVKGERVELGVGVHHLRVEYYEKTQKASLSLTASFDPAEMPSAIPSSLLTFPGEDFDEDEPCASAG